MNETEYVANARTGYDAVAVQYADTFRNTIEDNPFDRAMIGVFAEIVNGSDHATVADVGCGPGRVTGYLHELGVDVFGVDLSPEMLAIARTERPHLRFSEGRLTALDVADGALGGVLSRNSIIHTPPERLTEVFAEFHRVLAPGGLLLLAFFSRSDASQLGWPFDHKVAPAYELSVDRVADLLRETGFTEIARLIEAPPQDSRRPCDFADLLVRKADTA